jgi:hypothetical protein
LKTKPDNPLKRARAHIENGKYIIRRHAIDRKEERLISLADILHVLNHGFHEEEKTLFDIRYQTWKYAIRGKTFDCSELRVIVAFAEEMAIITVMRVTKKRV